MMTVEEFWTQYADQPYELVSGNVVEAPPRGFWVGVIAVKIMSGIGVFADTNKLGETLPKCGFALSPHDLLGPTVAFVSRDKIRTLTDQYKFVPFAPDLAVEVLSPDHTASQIRRRIALYFAAGTQLVWIVYPELRKVDVHFPDGTARTIDEAGVLDGGEVLPGLQIAVSAIFPAVE